ncbi:uncharacterized protein N7458_011419 [Penicillium daleae]|uniref:Uncharacterized protein n=1 Tax=Penicillium daleae TaxID=63821 RepID=A0AAD6BT55_9EURO|nr:uncharacterized protein N7458_011419 [Penicillium daleae]KAJ5432263.1 hypothetical protein N7458_011419 [Penicillium daleae]
MRISGPFNILRLLIGLAVIPFAAALVGRKADNPSNSHCSRVCMTNIVTQVLDSMVAHNPYALPMAPTYRATENSHPAALGMMTSWRTITKAGPPSLLAIDTTNGTAYFALDISEGNDATESVLRGRLKVVHRQITEIELFINRYRGDHGFSFSAAELPTNYEVLMSPPANRTKASRATLEALSESLFATSSNFSVTVGDACQFTELGWKVVDPGTNGTGSTDPLGCVWPSDHPTDTNARVGLVIDEELGFVVTSGTIPGKVYPYGNISAFIPDAMTSAQEAQEVWIEEMNALGIMPLLSPTGATGDTLEVLQYYNGELQAMQINVYLSGPDMTSPWL